MRLLHKNNFLYKFISLVTKKYNFVILLTIKSIQMSNLQEQIDLRSKEIHTDSYPISLGEVMSMYKDGDIDIHPEFQRFFRWTPFQKTMLIESILLNIPIPPIFVAQRKDGIWDIVDGLQRMSTILQFVGILKNEDKEAITPLVLEKTKLLPFLENKTFGEEGEENENTFTEVQRRYFKRAKLSFIIIQKESDDSSKYELFQRLNTGGSALTAQEVRSCLMVMVNSEIFRRIKLLTGNEDFNQCIKLSDKNIEEQYNLELIIRFICLRKLSLDEINSIVDLSEYLNSKIVEYISNSSFDWDSEISVFNKTFQLLNNTSKEKSFERYNIDSERFTGGFLVSAFEIVAFGIGYNPEIINSSEIEEKVKGVWQKIAQDEISWKGFNAAGRLNKTLKLGRQIFQNEEI